MRFLSILVLLILVQGWSCSEVDLKDPTAGQSSESATPYEGEDVCEGCDSDFDEFTGNLCEHESVVFCEDFESGNLDQWNDYDENSEVTVPTDLGPFRISENAVARLYVPYGERGYADLNRYFESEGKGWDKLYLRWYQKWETAEDSGADDYDFSAENHGSGLTARDSSYPYTGSGIKPTGSDKFTSRLEPSAGAYGRTEERARPFIYTYYKGMYMDCYDPNGSCWGDHLPCLWGTCDVEDHRPDPIPPKFEVGKWYCLQLMVDSGTTGPTGAQNFWIDGIQYGPWENLHMRDTMDLKINTIQMSLFHHEVNTTHSDAGIRIDDVIAATQPIPCERIER